MITSYDYRLVVLSIITSILASYAALDLAGRVTAAPGTRSAGVASRRACAMGMGICSMHYIGMLVFSLLIAVAYDGRPWQLPAFALILASGVALFVVSLLLAGLGSVATGGGIAVMLHRHGCACSSNPSAVIPPFW
jgi:NO-binding membrane sensor protein with MHYT domain